ncbi:hypothetical protein Aduo_013032 [Ancylostoma duodenale]
MSVDAEKWEPAPLTTKSLLISLALKAGMAAMLNSREGLVEAEQAYHHSEERPETSLLVLLLGKAPTDDSRRRYRNCLVSVEDRGLRYPMISDSVHKESAKFDVVHTVIALDAAWSKLQQSQPLYQIISDMMKDLIWNKSMNVCELGNVAASQGNAYDYNERSSGDVLACFYFHLLHLQNLVEGKLKDVRVPALKR